MAIHRQQLHANQYGLDDTDATALDVAVEVSATDSAPQALTVAQDASRAEKADC